MDSVGGIYGSQSSEEILIRDTVTKETKARYDELLTMISDILVKSPATEADSIALDACFKELQEMQKKGLDSTMNDTLNLLYFYMEGAGANPSQGDFKIDPVKIEALNSDKIKITLEVPDENGVKTTQELKLAEAIKAMVDPNYNPKATDTLSKMLIDYSKHGYEFYTSELEGLKQQLDIASTSINYLKALQDILNMVDVNDPKTIPLNPQSWDEIPVEFQDEILNKIIHTYKVKDLGKLIPIDLLEKVLNELSDKDAFFFLNGDATIGDLSPNLMKEVTDYIKGSKFEPRTEQNLKVVSDFFKKNPDTYADMVESLSKEGIGVTPTPQPNDIEAMNRLIGARDELQKQFDALNALGDDEVDKGEGSAWATLKTVLEDLEKYVPTSTYPAGSKISTVTTTTTNYVSYNPPRYGFAGEILRPVRTTTTSLVVESKNGSTTPIGSAKVNEDICSYISAGHGKDNNINEAIDNAVNASQNLSSKMSDEIKAQNLNLQTWFDILTQVADSLNKTMQAIAQKTGN